MKANELMIGDFVTFKDCQNDKEIMVIKIWHLSQEGNALPFLLRYVSDLQHALKLRLKDMEIVL